MIVRPEQSFLGLGVAVPDTLPGWLTDADLDFYTQELVTLPALYVVGDRDVTYRFPGGGPGTIDALRPWVPNLKHGVVLEGCGHWTQQERAEDVNRLLIEFLRSL
jgi:pimeloyl-ACP methyl ester carboxylesterase